MTFAYRNPDRSSHLNLKEAAQEAWRGLTAFVQGEPYLVIDKDGSTFVLEGEDGTIRKLENFEWEVGGEGNKLVAASRIEGSPLAKGRSFDGVFMGHLAFEDGRWEVLTEDGSAVVPIDEYIEHLASENWIKNAGDDTLLWLLQNDGTVLSAPANEVHNHTGLIYQVHGSDPAYGDLYTGPYQAMGEVRNGQVHLSSLLPPDYMNAPAQWEAIKVGRQVRQGLKQQGVPTSMTMTASAPGGDVEYPLYSAEKLRQVNAPETVRAASMGMITLPPGGVGGHTMQHFAQNGLQAQIQYPPTTEMPEGAVGELPGPMGPHQQWLFSHWNDNGRTPKPMDDTQVELLSGSHSPEELEQAMIEAERMKRGGSVDEGYLAATAAIESAHEDGLSCSNCGSHSMRALGVELNVANMKCLTCGHEWKQDVMKNHDITSGIFDDSFRPGGPSVRDLTNDIGRGTHEEHECPNCGSEYWEDGGNGLLRCTDCGNEWTEPEAERPEYIPGQLRGQETYHSAWQKGSPYPSDSYKNAPDHTPDGQKKWPAEVNAVYNACMRDGKGDKEKCAKIAWSQYDKTQKKDAAGIDPSFNMQLPGGQDNGFAMDNCPNCGANGMMTMPPEGVCNSCGMQAQTQGVPGYSQPGTTYASVHEPGTRIEVQHPSAKGQRGSILKHKGTDSATGEDTYDILLDTGEKSEGLRASDIKRIKSAKFDSSEHFLESLPILIAAPLPFPSLAPQAPPPGQSYPGYTTEQGTLQACPNCGSTDTGPAATNGYSNPQMYTCHSCGTVFQPKTAATKESILGLQNYQELYLALVGSGLGLTYGKQVVQSVIDFLQKGMKPEEAVHEGVMLATNGQNQGVYDQEAEQQAIDMIYHLYQEGPTNDPIHSHTSKINDVNGSPLTPGNWYVMHSPKYKVPDVVHILNLEDNRIEASIEGDEDHHFPLHIMHDEIGETGYSFEPYTHAEEERREHTANDLMARQQETAQRVQQLLSEGASEDEVKAVIQQYYAIIDQQNDMQEQALQQAAQPAPNQMPGQMLTHKEARKNFTPAQQRELVNENLQGRARNFDKLNLEGTHYEAQVKEEDDPFFLWL